MAFSHVKLSNNRSVMPLDVRGRTRALFCTEVPEKRTGLLLVGLDGNNSSTLTATCLANKRELKWRTRAVVQSAT